jgi:hypothetical protein
MTCTTFRTPHELVFCTSRTPDLLRSSVRNETIDGVTISNRSNYTRVTFRGTRRAAFLIPVGPYALRVSGSPICEYGLGQVNVIGNFGDRATMSLSPSEMRAMAYGLLAAANWIDTRDTEKSQMERRPSPR